MTSIRLDPLSGRNPLGFFAALGLLDVVDRNITDGRAGLSWTNELLPRPIVAGVESVEELIEMVLIDREAWRSSVVLEGPNGERPMDIKPDPASVRSWFRAAGESAFGADLPLLHALISEGARAGTGDSKPTHLHFTAGQQKFLDMCRTLRDQLATEHLTEALVGPWTRTSELPVLGWDNEQGERLHALSRTAPSSGKKTGVPAADWLGLLGLRFLPVSTNSANELLTTGCAKAWKVGGHFTWPLWEDQLEPVEVAALLNEDWGKSTPVSARARGVSAVFRAEIRRADQGGYGSFGPTLPLI